MLGMLQTGLDFAPNTSDDFKNAVKGLFKPEELFSAYHEAKVGCQSNDLVVVATESGLHFGTRAEYATHLHRVLGDKAAIFSITKESAHSVMKLPADSIAMWFVVIVDGMEIPPMSVIFGVKYQQAAAIEN